MAMTPSPEDFEELLDELPVDRETWLAAARAALENAHSPYSGVRVGAALVARDGSVIAGCNVENASYGLTICAERNAIGQAVAAGVGELVAIAIATNREEPLMPCGACRQVLMEFAPRLVVVCEGAGGRTVARRLTDLLPDAFQPRDIDGGDQRRRDGREGGARDA